MKKTIILTALLIAVLLANAAQVPAQAARRIQFAKGKSSALVKGSTGKYGVAYLVNARSGQKLALSLTPPAGVGIKVEIDGRYGRTVLLREERGGTFEVGLEESGDYTIFIGSTEGRPVSFTLGVKITRMTDI